MTKKITTIFLFSIFIVLGFYSYQKISSNKNETQKNMIEQDNLNIEGKNNLIKNLRYDVNFENNTKYNITADLSELIYDNNDEIVKMQKVKAFFIDKGGLPLTITSDIAIFNNTTYNTSFKRSSNRKIKNT